VDHRSDGRRQGDVKLTILALSRADDARGRVYRFEWLGQARMPVHGRFQYKCLTCEELHDGYPALAFGAPDYYLGLPEDERTRRCLIDEDACIIDGEHYFVRCTMEYPVRDSRDTFSWGVWGSLSAENFEIYVKGQIDAGTHLFSYLSNALPSYPGSHALECQMCVKPPGTRPSLIVSECDHLLYHDQQNGIDCARALELVRPFIRWHS
jgi:hypothetical protein